MNYQMSLLIMQWPNNLGSQGGGSAPPNLARWVIVSLLILFILRATSLVVIARLAMSIGPCRGHKKLPL